MTGTATATPSTPQRKVKLGSTLLANRSQVLHVVYNTICGDMLVVRGLEDIVFTRTVNKTRPQIKHYLFEFFGLEEFMWESWKGKVEEIGQECVL